MKLSNLFIVLFILIFITKINAQNYRLDNTDPSVFIKYKIPDTDLKSLWFNTSLNFNSNKQDYNDDPNVDSYYHSNFGYSLHPYYYLLKESDYKYFNINANIFGSYSHSYSEDHYPTDPFFSSDKNNNYSTNIALNVIDKNYLNRSNIFYSLGSNINVNMSDYKYESNYRTISHSYNGSKTQNYNFSFGVGVGKIRNVTPIVTAIRFQERLKQINLLDKNFSNETIENLAQQFSRQDYFSSVHVRPDKYLWQSIDNSLSKEGISLSGLNMYSSAYLMETLNEIRFLRQEGCMVGFNFQLDYQNTYQANDDNHQIDEAFFTLANAYINYSHQLNLNSQVNLNLSLRAGPNVIAHPEARQFYRLDAGAGYNYEITDRLVTSVSDQFGLEFQNKSMQQKILTNNFMIDLNYFVEDNLSFNLNYSWQYSTYKNYYLYNPSANNSNSISAGFTYYIDRGILIN